MLVQTILLPDTGQTTWILLGNDYLPVEPVNLFLAYLRNCEKSPNTVKNYAHHCKLFWEFLTQKKLQWDAVNLDDLAGFINWLRRGKQVNVINIDDSVSNRTERTVNTIIAALSTFYSYHERLGNLKKIPMFKAFFNPNKRYKPILHHISKRMLEQRNVLKLKEPKRLPQILTQEQVKQLIDAACNHRDRFLIGLIDETGMRIGEALGLRHSDIISYDNQINIVKRLDNENGARVKGEGRTLDVSRDLIVLYQNYLVYELGDSLNDYVFVNLWDGRINQPMCYGSVAALFRRLSKKVGFHANVHMLRHTHATELLRAGNDIKHVQVRLGHSNIYSTEIYLHLTKDDLKTAHKQYLERRSSQ